MILLGLLLILAALGAAMFAVMAPSAAAQTIEVSALGLKVSASPLAMFVAGALSVVLLGLGFALISRGARRRSSSRKELRELRKGQAATDPQTPAEAGQHSSRRDRAHAESGTGTGTATSTADTSTGTANTGTSTGTADTSTGTADTSTSTGIADTSTGTSTADTSKGTSTVTGAGTGTDSSG